MKNQKKWFAVFLAVCLSLMPVFAGCGNGAPQSAGTADSAAAEKQEETNEDDEKLLKTQEDLEAFAAKEAPQIEGLTFESELQLDYAKMYRVFRYDQGYDLIDIADEGEFLVVPDGMEAPEGLPEEITVIHPPKNIYLAATALMALFVSMDALDCVDTTSLQADGWTFDAPKEAMREGRLLYAGKYSEPDYELLLDRECDLAIESTMIYHTPEVQEMIEDLGIPVFVDRSSYEDNPLGRAEWIKLYAVMTGHESEAGAFFEDQKQKTAQIEDTPDSGKTVAFFYIATDGKAVVRSSADYVPAMIKMAGGEYIFDGVTDDDGKSSVPMTIEAFYDIAADADIIIYNQSIDNSVQSVDDLMAKDPVMSEMKAVRENNVWVTGSSMYQRTDIAADIILEFHQAIAGQDDTDLQYLKKLK